MVATFGWRSFVIIFTIEILDVECHERNHIVDDWHIECPHDLVVKSCNLVEKGSLTELDVPSSMSIFRGVVTYNFEVVFTQWFEVKLWNFHDDMKGNEMNDTNLNFSLER